MRLLFSCTFLILSFYAHLGVADACIQGQWSFSREDSDDIDKTLRKYAKYEEKQAKFKGLTDQSVSDIKRKSVMGLPRFILSSAPLLITKSYDFVIVRETGSSDVYQRRLSTNGQKQSVSLTKINAGVNSVIASWDGEGLVVETTTPQGIHVEETFTLDDDKNLHINSRVSNGFSVFMALDKVYVRQLTDAEPCI